MSYGNHMLKFNFIALQAFGQIFAPVTDSLGIRSLCVSWGFR